MGVLFCGGGFCWSPGEACPDKYVMFSRIAVNYYYDLAGAGPLLVAGELLMRCAPRSVAA